jgi:hypothetical protein
MINEKHLENPKKTKHLYLNNERGKTKGKKHRNVLIASEKAILKSNAGQKEVEQKVKDQSTVKRKNPKRKRAKKRHIQSRKVGALQEMMMM